MIIPEDGCSTMNADWLRASIEYAVQNIAFVTKVDAVIAARN
jgi:gluconolactonase